MKQKMILLVMLLLLGLGYSNAQYGPVVSLSFDDGGPTWYDLGFPVFQEYGVPGVCFINATNWWVSQGQSSIDKLLEMQAAGWEIGNHTYDHETGVTEPNVSAMADWLNANGFLPNSGFQQPGGGYGPPYGHATVNIVKKYHPYYTCYGYLSGNSEPYDIYGLTRTPMENAITDAEIIAALDGAVANSEWVIFYGHPIGDDPTWQTSVDRLRLIFNGCNTRGIPIKTVREVITDLYPPGRVIECSEDTLQEPVLTYFEEGDSSLNTSVWNEYWHSTTWTGPKYVGSPVVYCHTSNDTLPVMKFYRNVPNGEYEVRATIILYDIGRTYRLFYSLNDENNPSQDSMEVNKNSDVSLGTVTVTNGEFALYTQKAVSVSGGDGFVGWAYIRLIAQACADVKVYLQGSYTGGGTMTTSLNSSGMIPIHHPFNDTLGIWNYTGSERAYNIPADIVDWVLVELRTGTEANTTVGRRAALLKSDGSIVDLDGLSQVKFIGIFPGSYYIVIRHRNHLPIMSANPVSLYFTNSLLYDFSNAQTQAYGTEPMADLGGNVFGMYAGDGNEDGGVYGEDYILYQASQGEEGYRIEDYNMDGGVYGEDYILYQLNQGYENWVP